MRKLILITGASGSGKSTFIKDMNLDMWHLSVDKIRDIYRSPEINGANLYSRNQSRNSDYWALAMTILEERMSRGELVVFEALTFDVKGTNSKIDKLVERYDYEVLRVHMEATLEEVIERNSTRTHPSYIVESVLRSIYEKSKPPHGQSYITENLKKEVYEFLHIRTADLSGYKKVIHVGDIHGCYDILKTAIPEIDPENYYILTGDWLDRGVQNGEVMEWIVSICDLPNVTLIFGNHERHIKNFLKGERVSDEFRDFTLPQIRHIPREDLAKAIAKTVMVFPYKFHDYSVVATHAGIPNIAIHYPTTWASISDVDYYKGDSYGTDVDAIFNANQKYDYQVHGHRNAHLHDNNQPNNRSFNLESCVETGGHLSVATLTRDEGFVVDMFHNKKFRSWDDMRKLGITPRASVVPQWKGNHSTKISDEMWEKMVNHEHIRITPLEDRPHISSVNFTRTAFTDNVWDDVSMTARGLFVNTITKEIVARGYQKFFNDGERGRTSLEDDSRHIAFPVTVYQKENGFYGSIGYDSETGDLLITSKSRTNNDHSKWFRDILDKALTPQAWKMIRDYVVLGECCFVFEVIDPINDPHIIEYETPHLVLLDVFHRSLSGQTVSDNEYKGIFAAIGKNAATRITEPAYLTCRRMKALLDDSADLSNYIANFESSWEEIEGVVLVDANGFRTKLKSDYYNFWKKMRGATDRLINYYAKNGMEKGDEEAKNLMDRAKVNNDYDARLWIGWLSNMIPANKLPQATDIINLRKLYQADRLIGKI